MFSWCAVRKFEYTFRDLNIKKKNHIKYDLSLHVSSAFLSSYNSLYAIFLILVQLYYFLFIFSRSPEHFSMFQNAIAIFRIFLQYLHVKFSCSLPTHTHTHLPRFPLFFLNSGLYRFAK